MKRVLIITYYWPPSGGAGVQRWLKFTKFLPEFSWEPVILTVDPDKASYPVEDHSLFTEIDSDTMVIRTSAKQWFSLYKKYTGGGNLPYGGFANDAERISLVQKIARFVRGNFFLPDPRKGWNRYAYRAASEYLSDHQVDIIITTGPPHSTHLIGRKLRKHFDVPWIADFRDPWTDIFYYRSFYPTPLAHYINRLMELSVLRKSDRILTVSPSWKSMLQKKINVTPDKFHVLTNGFDPEDFPEIPQSQSDRFTLTYLGTVADSYPIDGLVHAFLRLIEKVPEALLRFVGTLSENRMKRIMELPARNYEIIPYVDHSTAISYLCNTSALLLIIPSHSSNQGIIPGKVFEYIAAARPIICLGPADSDSARIISEAQAGKALSPEDTDSILATLTAFHENPIPVEPSDQYSRKTITRDLSKIMNSISRS